jgi:hypothetical protein
MKTDSCIVKSFVAASLQQETALRKIRVAAARIKGLADLNIPVTDG